MNMLKKILSWLQSTSSVFFFIVAAATTILILATAYTAWHANLGAATDSDGIVNTYLFSDFHLRDMVVPGNHTLILKWPLFAVQSMFPYTFISYTLLNFFFFFVAIFGWCIALTILLGKRLYPAIAGLLSLFLIGSTLFPQFLIYGSLRNIEYPIGLFFIFAIKLVLGRRKASKWLIAYLLIISTLFSLAIASDSLMIISFALPLLCLFLIYWLKDGLVTKRLVIAIGLVVVCVVLGILIKKLSSSLGLAILHYDDALRPRIAEYSLIWPSVGFAFEQLFKLVGASITGLPVSLDYSFFFVKFIALLMGIFGIGIAIYNLFKSKTQDILNKNFALAFLGISFLLTLLAYILLGMVYHRNSSGELVDAESSRYIQLLPLILVAGVLSAFRLIKSERRRIIFIIVFIIVASFAFFTSFATIKNTTQKIDIASNARINTQKSIAAILRTNNVEFIGSGYWDGATTRFWSDDSVKYVSISSCNHTGPNFNTRKSWLKEGYYSTTALVIDRFGFSAGYWNCTDDNLQNIYGRPIKKIYVNNTATSPEVWLYSYDIRSKIISE